MAYETLMLLGADKNPLTKNTVSFPALSRTFITDTFSDEWLVRAS